MYKYLLLILFPFFIFSCESEEDISSFKSEDTSRFNALLKERKLKNEEWVENPTTIVLQLFKPIEANSFQLEKLKILPDTFQVMVTQEGLQDDSAFGEKRIITLIQQEGIWLITESRVGWKCHEGRGQQFYSGTFCN